MDTNHPLLSAAQLLQVQKKILQSKMADKTPNVYMGTSSNTNFLTTNCNIISIITATLLVFYCFICSNILVANPPCFTRVMVLFSIDKYVLNLLEAYSIVPVTPNQTLNMSATITNILSNVL